VALEVSVSRKHGFKPCLLVSTGEILLFLDIHYSFSIHTHKM